MVLSTSSQKKVRLIFGITGSPGVLALSIWVDGPLRSGSMSLIEDLRKQEQFLTTKSVMALLDVRRNTLCDWVQSGRIPAVRTGAGYRFDPCDLADWLTARSTGAIRRKA
jgi:excisionase family DNA binding protein